MLRTITTVALLALAATAAQAAPLDTATTRVVYGDLNLSSASDAKVLADRLEVAAKQVCLDSNFSLNKSQLHECMDEAIAIATSDIEYKVESHAGDEVHAHLISLRQQISMD